MRIQRRWLWLRVASVIILLIALSIGILYILPKQKTETKIAANVMASKDSILPGTSGAILTLANGQKVILEQASIGNLTRQGGSALRKADDSLLVYQASKSISATDKVTYNVLETPKGRQFSVVLPDGSRVWLNAASSLKYPTAFRGTERVVELKGEGYFEVVHNDKMPFKVKTTGQVVEDIGTTFNINAYSDEQAVRTTLLNGSVKVSSENTGKQVILEPGQRASNSGQNISISMANTKETIAWKNGYFEFQHEDIRAVMRQFARWYNVEVAFEPDIPQRYFTGDIDRNSSVSQALKVLSFAKVHFKVQGHTITVIP